MGITYFGFSSNRNELLEKREISRSRGERLTGNSFGEFQELFRIENSETGETLGYEFLWVNKTGNILSGGKVFPGYKFHKTVNVPLNKLRFVRETSFNSKERGGVFNYNTPHMVTENIPPISIPEGSTPEVVVTTSEGSPGSLPVEVIQGGTEGTIILPEGMLVNTPESIPPTEGTPETVKKGRKKK